MLAVVAVGLLDIWVDFENFFRTKILSLNILLLFQVNGSFMKVILKQKVSSLGKAGDLIKVNDGYARNTLFPRLAIEADEKNIKLLEHEKEKYSQ